MANTVDPDQTAPIGAVCSGSTLFASIRNSSVMLGNWLFAADDFSRRHFQMHFFLVNKITRPVVKERYKQESQDSLNRSHEISLSQC